MKPEIKICCICGKPISGWGNNPAGAAWGKENGDIEFPEFKEDDECCNECNTDYVIPGRLYRMKNKK